MDRGGVDSGARGGSTGSQGGATAADVGQEARDAAGEVVGEVQRQATQRLQQQVDRASERLGGFSSALLAVGRQLREQDDAGTAAWVDRAAEQADRLAGYLRGKDMDDLVYEGERFARRQPALFLGGAFALGLLAARFLKSSHQQEYERAYAGRGYDASRYQGTAGYSGTDEYDYDDRRGSGYDRGRASQGYGGVRRGSVGETGYGSTGRGSGGMAAGGGIGASGSSSGIGSAGGSSMGAPTTGAPIGGTGGASAAMGGTSTGSGGTSGAGGASGAGTSRTGGPGSGGTGSGSSATGR